MKRAPAILAIALAFFACLPAFAEIKIEGDTSTKLNRFVELKANGLAPGSACLWRVYDPTGKRLTDAKQIKVYDGGVLFVGPGGTYRVELLAASYDEKTKRQSFEEAFAEVKIGDGTPEPNPPTPNPPGPGPNPPTPTPAIKKGWVVVIEETSEAAADRGKWLGDKALHAFFKSNGWQAAVADKDVKDKKDGGTPGSLAPYIERAKAAVAAGKKYPQIYIVDDATRNVVFEGGPPASPAEFLKLLQSYRGGK